jgi:hypothetical protein
MMPNVRPIPWLAAGITLMATLCGCGSAATATSSEPSAPSASPVGSAPVATIRLNVAPANLGCDAMGVPYRSLTIRVDPAAVDQVTALTDDNAPLKTFWSAGFVGGPLDEPVVFDPDGNVVAREGEIVVIPDGQWPRLHGYFVCPSADAVYVLLTDPS